MAGARKAWNSLKEGDPQAVAVLAILLFLTSVGWFVHTLRAESEEVDFPAAGGGMRAPVATPTPFSAYIEAEQAFRTGEKPPNPFHLPWQPRTPPKTETKPEVVEQVAPVRPPRPTPVPPPVPIPSVTYLFQGTMTRPDGVRVALVAEPKEGRSHFLASGDSLGAFTVGDIGLDQLLLRKGEGDPLALRRGEVQTIELSP